MIRISQIKIPVEKMQKGEHDDLQSELFAKASAYLRVNSSEIDTMRIRKMSVDARKKPQIFYVYTVDLSLKKKEKEKKIASASKQAEYMPDEKQIYRFVQSGSERLTHRPVVVGSGPCGLFAAYMLAKAGYRPLILERGGDVSERTEKVEAFWKDRSKLDCNCNVQFGEGGAGAFSDGKLNTMVKDPMGRYERMLDILYEHGGPEDIRYRSKPHIGTDLLKAVVTDMRREMTELGAEYRFHAQVTDIRICNGQLAALEINHAEWLDAEAAVFSIGHSARDTFVMLNKRGIPMEAKPFAVGLRIQHPQDMINTAQYGADYPEELPASDYKLTGKSERTGRGVYSFCMCPGGYVVNASSEVGYLAVNGMSNHDRSGENANSALIVTVTPKDYREYSLSCDLPEELYGVAYQRYLEGAMYELCDGRIPIQLYGDFKTGNVTRALGEVKPAMKGEYAFADLRHALPKEIADSLEDAITAFGKKIQGFDREDCILAGIESRSSSPVRIPRTEDFTCSVCRGFYPAGEGAGYAGGISSAAIDGMKVAEAIAARYAIPDAD